MICLAQRTSAPVLAGRQIRIRRRLDLAPDLVRRVEAPHNVQVRSIKPGLKSVFAVEWKVVAHSSPPRGAQWHALNMLVLREVLADPICFASRADARISNCQRTDLHGGRQI